MATRAQEFRRWLDLSKSRSYTVYHTGHLAADRLKVVPVGGMVLNIFVEDVDEVGRAAMKASERKECVLLQRRLEDGEFEYIAIKI